MYHYRVKSRDSSSNSAAGSDKTFKTASAGVGVTINQQVYPNPYSLSSGNGIIFRLNTAGSAQLKIYTIGGKLVRDLTFQGGQIIWDGKNNAGNNVVTDLYIYKLTETTGDSVTGKLAVIK